MKFLFTLVSTGFRFGERFGRNIRVNQSNWFSMNCLVFLLIIRRTSNKGRDSFVVIAEEEFSTVVVDKIQYKGIKLVSNIYSYDEDKPLYLP